MKNPALSLYKPPFYRAIGNYIYDADGNLALNIRGWGRIQYLENSKTLQDAFGDLVVEALNEYFERKSNEK